MTVEEFHNKLPHPCFGTFDGRSGSVCSKCVISGDCYIEFCKDLLKDATTDQLPELLVSSSKLVRHLAARRLEWLGFEMKLSTQQLALLAIQFHEQINPKAIRHCFDTTRVPSEITKLANLGLSKITTFWVKEQLTSKITQKGISVLNGYPVREWIQCLEVTDNPLTAAYFIKWLLMEDLPMFLAHEDSFFRLYARERFEELAHVQDDEEVG